MCFGGLFDKEEQAAMSVNLLCDKMGKERKNLMIDIKPDVIQQVNHSFRIIYENLTLRFLVFIKERDVR